MSCTLHSFTYLCRFERRFDQPLRRSATVHNAEYNLIICKSMRVRPSRVRRVVSVVVVAFVFTTTRIWPEFWPGHHNIINIDKIGARPALRPEREQRRRGRHSRTTMGAVCQHIYLRLSCGTRAYEYDVPCALSVPVQQQRRRARKRNETKAARACSQLGASVRPHCAAPSPCMRQNGFACALVK